MPTGVVALAAPQICSSSDDADQPVVVALNVRCFTPMGSSTEELPTQYWVVAAVTVGCGFMALFRWGPGVALVLLVAGLGLGIAVRLMRTNRH